MRVAVRKTKITLKAILAKKSNFKPLPVLKMMYFNAIKLPKLRFLIKMRGRTTSYNKQFRRNENFLKSVKTSSIFMK